MDLYVKTGENEYTINIRGEIGSAVSGVLIAETIEHLNREGAKRIIEKINSNGGFIEEGFNIINANLSSNATIETINTGVAASIAAVILASGDVRKAYDNSYALIHDPQISGESLEKVKDENLKANLIKVKNTIVKTLVDACNQPENVIKDLMKRETAFTAKEQKEFGLVDKVVKSRVKPPKTRNLSMLEIMNHYDKQFTKNALKTANMEELTNYLNLNSDASEKNILKAVQAISDKSETFKNQALKNKLDLEKKAAENTKIKEELTAANDKLKSFHDQAVKNAVDSAINAGKFLEDQRETLTAQAAKDLVFFNEMVSTMPAVHNSVMNQIQNAGKTDGKTETKETVKDWDYYQKNDPDYLKNLEISNVSEYAKLYEAYWNEKYEITSKN